MTEQKACRSANNAWGLGKTPLRCKLTVDWEEISWFHPSKKSLIFWCLFHGHFAQSKVQLEVVSLVSSLTLYLQLSFVQGAFTECPKLAMKDGWVSLTRDLYSAKSKAVRGQRGPALSRVGSQRQCSLRRCLQNPEVLRKTTPQSQQLV